MSTGRTLARWARMYVNGYDLSGDIRTIGPLAHLTDIEEMEGLDWEIKGGLPGTTTISVGALNSMLNSDGTTKMHDLFNAPGSNYPVMVPIGIRAAPAQGDPCFCAQVNELGYAGEIAINSMALNLTFGGKPATTVLNHKKPWGVLLHAKAAKTAANTAAGADGLASSAYGGFMMYQIFAVSGTGTVEIKVQEADTNSNANFADLTGATSGAIAHTATPTGGIVQLAITAAVKRYLRWQIELTGITSVTFALGFVRSQAHNV